MAFFILILMIPKSRLRVFSVKKFQPLVILKYHQQQINCVGFSHELIFASGGKEGRVALWDLYAREQNK